MKKSSKKMRKRMKIPSNFSSSGPRKIGSAAVTGISKKIKIKIRI
jgi:hypothetical protein